MRSSEHRLRVRVEGRVQGVCFRHYTSKRARELELRGWVRNEQDGSVLVLAEGERGPLESLLEFLHRGPEHARVENVRFEWLEPQGDLHPFSVAR